MNHISMNKHFLNSFSSSSINNDIKDVKYAVIWNNWLWIPQPVCTIKGSAAWTLYCSYCSVIISLSHSAAVIWPCLDLSYTPHRPSFLHTNLLRHIDTWLLHSPVQSCSGACTAEFCLLAAKGLQCSKVTQCYCLLLRESLPAESQLTEGVQQKMN